MHERNAGRNAQRSLGGSGEQLVPKRPLAIDPFYVYEVREADFIRDTPQGVPIVSRGPLIGDLKEDIARLMRTVSPS